MNAKFTVRAIQLGQTQKNHTVVAGAGQSGQALVLQAAAHTRYQLADMLTYTSPAKLQIKRVGKDLLLALPGNDVASPDIVIRGYFEFEGMSISGLSATGEPMLYDTSSSAGFLASIMPHTATGVTDKSMAPDQTAGASLAKASSGWFDSGWGLAALGGGALLLGAAGGGGGDTPAGIAKITTYKGDANKPLPTLSDFAGVSGVTAANLTGITGYIGKTQLPMDSVSSVQTLVNAYNKVLAEANGSVADATPDVDPVAQDYIDLMGTSATAAILDQKAGAVGLLNDRVKALTSDKIDTYSKLKSYADAVQAVATLVVDEPSTSGTAATSGNISKAQLISLGADQTEADKATLAAVSDAMRANAEDLSSLNSTDKIKALVKAYNTILAEANGAAADGTTANPTVADYAAIGADIGSAKTSEDALSRLNAVVGQLASSAVDTVGEINKLAATLDKLEAVAALDTGAVLTDEQKFSVDELKNLGLSGFTATETLNAALAIAVSHAIRDKQPADVLAGDFANGKLNASTKKLENWPQTQLERLQSLVSLEVIKQYKVDTATPANTTLAPTLADWQNVGVFKASNDGTGDYTALSSTELAYLNSAADKLTAADLDTPAKAQAVFDAYARIIQEANGNATDANTTTPTTTADVSAVGVSQATSSTAAAALLLDVIANVAVAAVDSVAELQALNDTAAKIVAEAAKSPADASANFTTTELSNLGLRGVSGTGASSNVAAFAALLRTEANDGSTVNTVAKLQSLLSLAVLQVWARDVNPDNAVNPVVLKTAISPTAQDYKDIGVERRVNKGADGKAVSPAAQMSTADLNAVNDAIDTRVDHGNSATHALVADKAGVKAIAESYFRILNEANGSQTNLAADGVTDLNPDGNPVAQDYVNIGVVLPASLASERLSLLNTVVAEKSFGSLDTVKEVQAIADAVDKLLTHADAGGQALTLTELGSQLALQGINDVNLPDINAAIANKSAADVDTHAELQSLVSLTRIEQFAADHTASNVGDNGTPTFFDWSQIAGLNNEKTEDVAVYNKALEYKSIGDVDSLAELQGLVDEYNTYATAWAARVDSGNWGYASDVFHGALTQTPGGAKPAFADISGKLVDLAERANGVATTNASGAPYNFTGTDLTKANLETLGLDVTRIDNNAGLYDDHEMNNIWVAIQNSNPSDLSIAPLATLQGIINVWAVL